MIALMQAKQKYILVQVFASIFIIKHRIVLLPFLLEITRRK